MATDRPDRFDEELQSLLTLRAVEGLTASERARLELLLEGRGDVDAGAYDRAAAAVYLAAVRMVEPMPATLRARLARQGRRLVATDDPRNTGQPAD